VIANYWKYCKPDHFSVYSTVV